MSRWRFGRSRRVFCVGLPKAGTHSVARMLAGCCRTAHEPESEQLIPMLGQARSGQFEVGELRGFFTARDRRLNLEVEANHLLASFAAHLVDAFPSAKFMLLVRDCRSWTDSMINDQLNLRAWDGYPRWKPLYDAYLGQGDLDFSPQETLLRDLDLYPLSHYLRYWTEEIGRVRDAVPDERLLVLQTEELARSASTLAQFVGIPERRLALEHGHSYMAPTRHNVLDEIDQAWLDQMFSPARAAT